MNSRPRIKLKKGIHRKQEVILIEFPYDLAIIAQIRAIEGARWSPSMRCWYVPYTKQQELALKQLFKVGDLSKDIPSEKTSFIKDRGSDMNKKQVVIEKDPQTRRIYIQFPFDMAIKESIKGLDGSWWHQETKVWSVFWSPDNIKSLESIFSGRSVKWKESKTTVRKKYRTPLKEAKKHINPGFEKQLKIENKSASTISNYMSQVGHFLDHFKEEEIAYLSETKIRDYIIYLRETMAYSTSFQRLLISAINNYYRIVYNRDIDKTELPYPKKEMRLPKVISKEDVQRMINETTNPKHKMIIIMLYSLGLRNNELSLLKRSHIDFDREIITVYNAKGYKDRQLPLPKSLTEPLKKYLRDFAIRNYFLIGRNDRPYSGSSIGKVVKEAAEQVGVKLAVTPHVLRHCFATHSLEKGVDLRYIQAILGHSSSKTTEIYTHVSTQQLKNLSNPFDDIII